VDASGSGRSPFCAEPLWTLRRAEAETLSATSLSVPIASCSGRNPFCDEPFVNLLYFVAVASKQWPKLLLRRAFVEVASKQWPKLLLRRAFVEMYFLLSGGCTFVLPGVWTVHACMCAFMRLDNFYVVSFLKLQQARRRVSRQELEAPVGRRAGLAIRLVRRRPADLVGPLTRVKVVCLPVL
jgi:hypothetical protein